MTPGEIGEIAGIAAGFEVRAIKLTGGEPLIRKDICEIVREISRFGFDDISMTTNGVFLAKFAADLKKAGLKRVNVSLDTVDPATYERITRHRALSRVLRGIDEAIRVDLRPLKINMVLLSGINDAQVDEVMRYAFSKGAVLQIIEYICAGKNPSNEYHVDVGTIEKTLEGKAVRIITRGMQRRRRYLLSGGEVEVVRPVHNSEFCAACNRIRLTSDGRLKPCLMTNAGEEDILSYIRAGDTEGAKRAFLRAVMAREPFWKGYQPR